jgi:hypothetical protein
MQWGARSSSWGADGDALGCTHWIHGRGRGCLGVPALHPWGAGRDTLGCPHSTHGVPGRTRWSARTPSMVCADSMPGIADPNYAVRVLQPSFRGPSVRRTGTPRHGVPTDGHGRPHSKLQVPGLQGTRARTDDLEYRGGWHGVPGRKTGGARTDRCGRSRSNARPRGRTTMGVRTGDERRGHGWHGVSVVTGRSGGTDRWECLRSKVHHPVRQGTGARTDDAHCADRGMECSSRGQECRRGSEGTYALRAWAVRTPRQGSPHGWGRVQGFLETRSVPSESRSTARR